MNTNLQRVRDVIADAPDDLLDMATTGHPSCGSPGCIVGWALTLFPNKAGVEEEFQHIYDKLDLTREQGDNLSLATGSWLSINSLAITKDEVLTAIDSLLVDPARVMPAWPKRVQNALERWT